MLQHDPSPLDADSPDPDELVRAAMQWHFHPNTGSPFWMRLLPTLGFDPRTEIKCYADLPRFPSVAAELRTAAVHDLIPRGYGDYPDVVAIVESGGTTGSPKRVPLLRDWSERMAVWETSRLAEHGLPYCGNSLVLLPSGPHMGTTLARRFAHGMAGQAFLIDMDPRWVKRLIAVGRHDEADAYAEHLVDQAAVILRDQDVTVLRCTPPLLVRLARRPELVELVRKTVKMIVWTGTHMDADTRHLLRTEVFPNVALVGAFGNTMILGGAMERPGLADDQPCIFDSYSPHVSFDIVDPDTGDPVPEGQRGQVLTHHVSRSFFLPANPERDEATRIRPPAGAVGDSPADVAPIQQVDGTAVIEGVY